MANPNYFFAERMTYGLLNSYKADSTTDVDTIYQAATLPMATTATRQGIMNAMYPPSFIHGLILYVETIICRAIANTEGHPRRRDYLSGSISQLSNLDPLPSTLGAIGAVWDPATGNYLTQKEPDVIRELRSGNLIGVTAAQPSKDFYFGFDGSRFFSTLAGVANVELYVLTAAPATFALIEALFSTSTPVAMRVAEEFVFPVCLGAAGIAASKVGTFEREAASMLEMFAALMAQNGLTTKIPADFVPGAPTK